MSTSCSSRSGTAPTQSCVAPCWVASGLRIGTYAYNFASAAPCWRWQLACLTRPSSGDIPFARSRKRSRPLTNAPGNALISDVCLRRWVNCLLIRELPFGLAMRLWDTYLAEGTRMKVGCPDADPDPARLIVVPDADP